MANPDNTIKRDGGTFHFNMRVPTDLVAKLNKTHWRFSLKTKDRKAAAAAARHWTNHYEEEVRRLRAPKPEDRAQEALANLTPAERTQFLALVRKKYGLADPHDRNPFKFDPSIDFAKEPSDTDVVVRLLEEAATLGPHSIVSFFVDATVPRLSRMRDHAKHQIESGELEAARRAAFAKSVTLLQKVGVDVSGAKLEPIKQPGIGLAEVLGLWIDQKAPAESQISKNRHVVRRFTEVHGDLPVRQYTKPQVRSFVKALERFPNTREEKIFSLPFAEAVAAGEKAKKPCLKVGAIEGYLTALKTLFNVAVANDLIEKSPAQGVEVATKRRKKHSDKKRGFEIAELNQLFTALTARHDHSSDDFWIPVVALFSGMRLEEICQMDAADLSNESGVWAFSVTDFDEDQGIKNEGSLRTVPLHPFLDEIGFLKHLEKVKATGRLFPSLNNKNKNGLYSEAYGKRFARILRLKASIRDPRVSFHSFRHSFKTACRESDIPEEVHNTLTGHAGSNAVADGYGKRASARKLAPYLVKLEYEALQLDLLRPAKPPTRQRAA